MMKRITDTIAKISILPYSDKRFLQQDVFQCLLDSKNIYKDYETFKENTYKQIQEKYHIWNYDSISMMIEKYYPIRFFTNNKMQTSSDILMTRLDEIATCFISQRNGEFSLKYWRNNTYDRLFEAYDGFNKIELWNTFNRQFCMDILVADYLLENGMDDYAYLNGYYWLINIGDLQLDGILKKGVSETHLHLSAGMYFSTIWENLMEINSSNIESHPLLDEINRESFTLYLYQSSIFRLFVSSFLRAWRIQEKLTFATFIENYESKDFAKEIIRTIKGIMQHTSEEKSVNYKELYTRLRKKNGTIEEMLLDASVHTTPENVFLFECLKYLKATRDSFLAPMFWRYIVTKNIIYQGVTQNNNCSGLLYFQRYFRKAATLHFNESEYYLRTILLNQICNNHLTKLEVRVSPPLPGGEKSVKRQMCDYMIDILRVYKEILLDKNLKDRTPELGMVIHFVKSKDKRFFEKCWCLEDVSKWQYFYGKLQKDYLQIVKELCAIRQEIPELADYIVGIDAASVENNMEPWVFAPIYQNARDSKNKISNPYLSFKPIKNLGFTFHVGEDFRHVISGLRHIDEVVEHFGYHAGDRIGHGIALGIQVEQWYENNRIVMMPRIEYMENLLWIWGIGKELTIDFSYLEREILKLADEIYRNLQGITVYSLWKSYQQRFQQFEPDPNYMTQIGACNMEERIPSDICKRLDRSKQLFWDDKGLAHSYHCKCYLERMYEVIQVKVEESELSLIKECQKYVRDKISRNGIVVETNPTSNLSISDIERLFEHYILELNQKGLESAKGDGLILTVNSDDPAVFNTSTSNELAYMFYLLLDKGYSRDTILQWINKVRQWGVDTSFVAENTKNIETIDAIIEKLG